MVKVNRKFAVPYGAGSSKDNKTVYIDYRVPQKIKTMSGKKIDVVKALVAHETSEEKAMDRGMSYEKAHDKVAVPTENKEVRSQGASPREYNHILNKTLDKFAGKKKEIKRAEPPDLDPKPYKDEHKLSLLKKIVHK